MAARIDAVFVPDPDAPSMAPPLASARVAAGFPSPADDHLEGRLDLNEHLVRHPAATFFVRVAGDSMTGAGIEPGDLLVVDRSLAPADRSVVIAVVDGALTVKRLRKAGGKAWLAAENPAGPAVPLEGADVEIWGVVTAVVHPPR